MPIHISAQETKMLALASTIDDGILINTSNPKDYTMKIMRRTTLKNGNLRSHTTLQTSKVNC
ncbi:MAG: hypothetical protein NDF51_05085 [archaeon YNP-WB-040]|jgi:malate/lactate dehydrogenase|nr:hypothetical protein [Candidatus Culexarchaeum yellowstonense]